MRDESRMVLSWLMGGFTAFYAVADDWVTAGLVMGVFVVWFGIVATRKERYE